MGERENNTPHVERVTFGSKELPIDLATERVRAGATWFYWIAALSVVNTVAQALNLGVAMAIGLGITQIVDGVAHAWIEEDESFRALAILLSLFFSIAVASVYVFLGYHARKIRAWPYYVGIPLYALDALVFFWAWDWIGLGFHGFVLLMLFTGIANTRAILDARQRADRTGDSWREAGG